MNTTVTIRVEVKTPKGQAESAEKKLRWFLLGRFDKPTNTYTNDEGDTFYWEVTTSPKRMLEIQRNISRFQFLTGWILERKTVGKLADKKEDIETVKEMFKQTSVRLIKTEEANTKDETGESFWERVKKRFRREGGNDHV